MKKFDYQKFVSRNHTYIPDEIQKIIRSSQILIAGSGMGSTVAESAVRLGFENLTLLDGDEVEAHNLNRQNFIFSDVGESKVKSVARRLREINPTVKINVCHDWLNPANARDYVEKADLIFDAIDFLSMEAIVALHDEAKRQRKPIVSIASAGFGALAIYFPAGGQYTIRDFFGLPAVGPVHDSSYVSHFAALVRRVSPVLDPQMVQAMEKTFTVMQDGTPCPAPHTVVGANSMAALAMTLAVRIFEGKKIAAAPQIILFNMAQMCELEGLDISQVGVKLGKAS